MAVHVYEADFHSLTPFRSLPGIEPGRVGNSEFYRSKPGANASEMCAIVLVTVPPVLTHAKPLELLA